MKSEWNALSLSDLSDKIAYGYTASAKKNQDYSEPKFLRITDIQGGIVSWNSVPYCEIDDNKINTYRLIYGDILVARTGNSTGENYMFDSQETAVFASYLIRYSINKNIANPKFVWYQMRSNRWASFINNAKSGSAQAGANAKTMGAFECIIPPLPTQEKIAHILSTLDDKIELNRKMNQTLEYMAQAFFKSWFVDFDPVHAKAGASSEDELDKVAKDLGISREVLDLFPSEFEESELGLIPKGWGRQALDKVAHYQNGLALQKFRPKDENNFLPVLKIAQLKKGFADGEEKADSSIKAECIVNSGDVVFSWSGSLFVDIWCGGKVALNQHLFKVTSDKYSKWFYYYWTKQHLKNFQQIAADKAVTMGHIKRSHLAEALCVIPNEEVLNKLDEIIPPLLEKLIVNRLENSSLQKTRDTLLPKLLSGELDVSNLDLSLTDD